MATTSGGRLDMGDQRADESIELDLDGDGSVLASRPRWPLVVSVLGLLALVTGLAVLPADDDVEVSVEEQRVTTTTEAGDRAVPDPGSFPAPLALGGPTDGKESIGLPVKAEPADGLLDGQSVTVTGTGFPPGVSVGVVMCTKEAGQDHGGRGVEACNIGRFAQTESDADGVAVATFSVRRLVVLDGHEVDCASETQRCLIGMGMISDYDTSGGVLVDFDPTVALPDPPTVRVEPSSGLSDGNEATVSLTGLVPRSPLTPALCEPSGNWCVGIGHETTADQRGNASVTVRLWRVFGASTWHTGGTRSNVDCARERCQVQVWGEAVGGRQIPPVEVSFGDAPVERVPPELLVTSEGPYGVGDEIVIELHGVDADAPAQPLLCSTVGCAPGDLHVEPLGDDGQRLRLRVPPANQGNPCLEQPCNLVVELHHVLLDDGPPPLFPDPVPVAIEP